jgi:hypothetical protein
MINRTQVLHSDDVSLASQLLDFASMSAEQKEDCLLAVSQSPSVDMLQFVLDQSGQPGLQTWRWIEGSDAALVRFCKSLWAKQLLSGFSRKVVIERLRGRLQRMYKSRPRWTHHAMRLLVSLVEELVGEERLQARESLFPLVDTVLALNLANDLQTLAEEKYLSPRHCNQYTKKSFVNCRGDPFRCLHILFFCWPTEVDKMVENLLNNPSREPQIENLLNNPSREPQIVKWILDLSTSYSINSMFLDCLSMF